MVEMVHSHIRSLAVLQHGMLFLVDDYHGCCRRNQRALSFLERYVHAGRARGMDRWRACSIGTGTLSNVRQLDSTC
jgi:hypothetical protein